MKKGDKMAKEIFVSIGSPIISEDKQFKIVLDRGYLDLGKILNTEILPDVLPRELLNYLISISHDEVVDELKRRQFIEKLIVTADNGNDGWIILDHGDSDFLFIDREHGIDHVKFIAPQDVICSYFGFVFLRKVPKYEDSCFLHMSQIARKYG